MFPDRLLNAIGAWQRGWREDQAVREERAVQLQEAVASLPREYKSVAVPCYRKRFLHHGELQDLFFSDRRDEGVVSWTTKQEYAEIFKGLHKDGAITAAIFEIRPVQADVVININTLWQDRKFVAAVERYHADSKENSDSLMRFKDEQGEVVLSAPLRGSNIIALVGASSPFDELCDSANIAESDRDEVFRKLLEDDVYCGELRYVSSAGAQAVVGRVIAQMIEKISEFKGHV